MKAIVYYYSLGICYLLYFKLHIPQLFITLILLFLRLIFNV